MKFPVILGPTCSGKTAIGIALAKLIGGEIVSVDSRKVYRGIPAGTATPNGEWKNGSYEVDGVPHHLMAFLSPDQPYTAGDFAKDADALIRTIMKRGKTPLLVGGTGFYFKALRDGLPSLPNRNPEFRQALEKRIADEGLEPVYRELKTADPVSAAAIDRNDRHKIIRALEVIQETGEPYSSFNKGPKKKIGRSFLVMGLDFDRDVLETRIRTRSKKMAEGGMIEETERLLRAGYAKTCPALSSFGYREAVQVVDGTLSRDQFLPALIKGTLAYAKRQRTWLRTKTPPDFRIHLTPSSQKQEIALKIKSFL